MPCTSFRGKFSRSETATHLPPNCQAFAVRIKRCPSVCFLQSPKIRNYFEKEMATKGVRAVICAGPEDVFSSLPENWVSVPGERLQYLGSHLQYLAWVFMH